MLHSSREGDTASFAFLDLVASRRCACGIESFNIISPSAIFLSDIENVRVKTKTGSNFKSTLAMKQIKVFNMHSYFGHEI